VPERVLVTGATGFVGSHIARALAEAGREVLCGVRSTSGTRWIDDLTTERVRSDLESQRSLVEAVRGVQLVVHAAGITRSGRASDYHSINAAGTRRLAGAAAAAGVRRFVLISSLAARGPDASAKAGGDHPVSDYGRSKLAAETYLRDLEGAMEAIVLRPAAIYGPRDRDFLPLFKMARAGLLLFPSSAGPLQPVYVDDMARAALAATGGDDVGFGPFPVAGGQTYAWQDVVTGLEKAFERHMRAVRLPAGAFLLAGAASEQVARIRGQAGPFDQRRARDLAVHTWTCEVSGTEEALGWRAEVPLFEGLQRTARWYLRAGWLGVKRDER
jgi:nucleoside-diphosphate-sugar epimerase